MNGPHAGGQLLPVQLTSFVGREGEIARLCELLRTARLLTITGAGGSGKTRLALEVARHVVRERPSGVAWVDLASLADPQLVAPQVASTLGLHTEPGAAAIQTLLEVLPTRSPLLILDNCEHLADACAELVDTLLRGCPELQVLATSREALGVAGERAWLGPPLSLPETGSRLSPEDLASSEAVQLFVARAQDVLPTFVVNDRNAAAVVQICRRVDGIPLAIELAAARVKVLTPEQIVQRLEQSFDLLTGGNRTAPPRHRTLRAAIDWSYRLLPPAEQILLARLSVFSGGFSLEAAETVGGATEEERADVLDLLAALVDRSLVAVRERDGVVRYQLLETVRVFAREQLEEAGDEAVEAVRRLHAEHYVALAEAAGAGMQGYQRLDEWVPRTQVELDNFRSIMSWALEADPGLALRLAGPLLWVWVPRPSHWPEGTRLAEAALERAPASASPHHRATALYAAGILHFLQYPSFHPDRVQHGRLCQARLEEAASLADALGDRLLYGQILSSLTASLACTGDFERAASLADEAVRVARNLGEPWLLAMALISGVAFVHQCRGEREAGEAALREGAAAARAAGFPFGIWSACLALALITLDRGELGEAEALAREAAETALHLTGEDWNASRVVMVVAIVLAARGDRPGAARLLGTISGWRARVGTRMVVVDQGLEERLLGTLQTHLSPADLEAALAQGRALDMRSALAQYVEGLPSAAVDTERPPLRIPTAAAEISTERLSPESPESEAIAPAGAPELEVRALGPLEIRRQGKPLDPSVWSHAKPKELLLYLLSHPEGRTREQVGLAFWPEASAAQVRNSFHVLVHKLRKALGRQDFVVVEGERYRLNPDLGVWYDAAVFAAEMDAALRAHALGRGSRDRLATLLTLYRGDLMEGEYGGDWHLEVHDRLRRLYVDGLAALADMQMAEGDAPGATVTLESLVQKEDLNEHAYRRLLLCLAQTGRRDQALRHYARLMTLLENELQAEPEEETMALAEQIRAGTVGQRPAIPQASPG
jgi:predicted ATPase/DNA-binding SARP family transcriptional activator